MKIYILGFFFLKKKTHDNLIQRNRCEILAFMAGWNTIKIMSLGNHKNCYTKLWPSAFVKYDRILLELQGKKKNSFFALNKQ